MIRNTRLATAEEKATIIRFIHWQENPSLTEEELQTFPGSSNELQVYWQSASFIVIEIQNYEERLVVVNRVSSNTSHMLDVWTVHYLLQEDNTVIDLNEAEY